MNIDDHINRFRLASTEIFNHYYHKSTHDDDAWAADERFELVEEALFKSLVTWPAKIDEIPYYELQEGIRVLAKSDTSIPWHLNRDIEGGNWDHPQNTFTNEAVLLFESFFDWDQVDFKNNTYVRVKVHDWPSKKELIGKYALVEWQYVKFELA